MQPLDKEKIKAIECKHVAYTRSAYGNKSDMLTIKEIVHMTDGTQTIRLSFKENYKRPFWMTKKIYQKKQQKKEWEYLNKLDRYESKQIDLCESIVRIQGFGNPKSNLKMLARSPYLYGADISPQALVKAAYQHRWPNTFTPNTVAVIDSETDVVNGKGDVIILLTITMKNKAFIAVNENWLSNTANRQEEILNALNTHLRDDIEKRKIEFEIFFTDRPGEMVEKVMAKAHEWKPDFVTFWNIDYDMTVMIEALENEGYDLPTVFSDPAVPVEYRHFRYKRGPKIKVKADGTAENLASYDQWHVVECPASFFMIDSMCVFRQIRRAKGKFPSYSLDYTLETNLKRNKLYFNIGDLGKPGSIEWHVQMQMHHKVAYLVYNVFDCIGVELLDEKTRDLQTQISILSGFSEYEVFNSNPKRTSNDLHFFCLKNGKVAGTVSDQMVDELDECLLSLQDWIVTLPTHLVENNGIPLLRELPNVRSTVRKYVSDADITSTYPNGEIIMNLSKETTMMELGRIKGVTTSAQRLVGVNLTGGPVNAIEIMEEVMRAPTSWDLLDAFMQEVA